MGECGVNREEPVMVDMIASGQGRLPDRERLQILFLEDRSPFASTELGNMVEHGLGSKHV